MQITLLQWIELISALLGILGVWLNTKSNIMGWPIGIVSVILAALVYFQSRLFAEFGLQIFYAFSGLYGWWKWIKVLDRNRSEISSISTFKLLMSLLLGLILTVLIGYWLKFNTQADFPWIDSALAAFSLIAQVWLAQKYIENWLLWMVINLVSIGLYSVKELWFFLGFFLALFVLSFFGYFNWKKKWRKESY